MEVRLYHEKRYNDFYHRDTEHREHRDKKYYISVIASGARQSYLDNCVANGDCRAPLAMTMNKVFFSALSVSLWLIIFIFSINPVINFLKLQKLLSPTALQHGKCRHHAGLYTGRRCDTHRVRCIVNRPAG